MGDVLRYMYLPVIVGGGRRSVLLALRLYMRYRMVSRFYSAETRNIWRLLPWLYCEPLPTGCSGTILTDALLSLCEENGGYIPLLFLSPAWNEKLSEEERVELESRFILCDEASVRKLTALFSSSRRDPAREDPLTGTR